MRAILLVDDHPLYHEGLASAFARRMPDYRIVSAGSAEEGLALLEATADIDLALIDLVLPTMDGFAALALFGRACPHVPRVLISGKEDAGVARRALLAGASGFLPKSLPLDALLAALCRVLDGEAVFGADALPGTARAVAAPVADQLSLRQLEVLKLLGEGRSNKEISRQLSIADRTVRAHLTELFRTFGVTSRTQAILAAQRLQLLPELPPRHDRDQ